MRPFGSPQSDWHRPPGFRYGWQNKRRHLFWGFARFIGLAFLLFLLGMAGLAYGFTHLFGGGGQVTYLVWLVSCGLAVAFPLVAGGLAMRSFSSMVNPLARVMAAADEVADGNLDVRVPENGTGEFARLAISFNRMVAELGRTDQLRRSLMADVAHELRTPLQIIQGNLEGILDGVYEPTPEQINILLDETRQLTRLVDDLRTLSLAEAGQLPLKKEEVKVAEVLADVATTFSGQAETLGIVLQVEAGQEPASLVTMGDAGRLDQILSNLVANALRHTPAGGRITLLAAPFQNGIRIQVTDTGSGISKEDLPFIFDRFWHGSDSTHPGNNGGSGLGLAIARQLVQAQGGHLSVQSEINQGTTFTIDLPEVTRNDDHRSGGYS